MSKTFVYLNHTKTNNMISFQHTEEQNGIISYYNMNGEVVKTYPLSELEKYVTDKNLNITYEHTSIGGTGMVSDPNTDFQEIEIIIPVSEYIDSEWDQLTKDFYNSKNK